MFLLRERFWNRHLIALFKIQQLFSIYIFSKLMRSAFFIFLIIYFYLLYFKMISPMVLMNLSVFFFTSFKPIFPLELFILISYVFYLVFDVFQIEGYFQEGNWRLLHVPVCIRFGGQYIKSWIEPHPISFCSKRIFIYFILLIVEENCCFFSHIQFIKHSFTHP